MNKLWFWDNFSAFFRWLHKISGSLAEFGYSKATDANLAEINRRRRDITAHQ